MKKNDRVRLVKDMDMTETGGPFLAKGTMGTIKRSYMDGIFWVELDGNIYQSRFKPESLELVTPFAIIDIMVNYFEDNDRWYQSCLSHVKPGGGDDSPESWGDAEEFTSKKSAIRSAESLASWLISSKETAQVTILVEGNERKTVRA